ncbi:MAG: hypothetical protein ABH827_03410, partial [bacterium]
TDAELSKYFEDFTKKKDDFFKTDEEILAERVSSLQQALECLKEKLIKLSHEFKNVQEKIHE